jgi:aromatic ring-cleaving dioxygenase
MARAPGASDPVRVHPLRSADTSGHRAFAVWVGSLILLCVVVSFAYAATAGV